MPQPRRRKRRNPIEVAADRPAETAGGSLGVLIGAGLAIFDIHLAPEEFAFVLAGVGIVPGIVSKIVDRIRGV